MVCLTVNEQCKALRAGSYSLATIEKINKQSARIRYADGSTETVANNRLWKMKKTKASHTTKGDVYTPRMRLGRFRRRIDVIPTRFSYGQTMGNYALMLADPTIRTDSVCCFNDNTGQWERAGLNPTTQQWAGGGNACARPYEYLGDAIGMPTGPYASLDETHMVQFPHEDSPRAHTAKEIIDEATNRIARLFIDHPDKTKLYFSVNPSDPPDSTTIGLAIFAGAVGQDVVQYISTSIQSIPTKIEKARREGVRP